MSALQCLLLIFALIILVPTAGHFLRKWDYERQISGKRPERKAKKNMRLPEEKARPIWIWKWMRSPMKPGLSRTETGEGKNGRLF